MKRRLMILATFAMLLPLGARAAELWSSASGFKVESAGWADMPLIQGWTGLKIGFTVPANCALNIAGKGALEIQLPGKGWVADKGMFISDGCEFDPRTAFDTSMGLVVVESDFSCDEDGGRRVRALVCLPKFFPPDSYRPTAARWVGSKVRFVNEERQ
jgi:hypothetical protein